MTFIPHAQAHRHWINIWHFPLKLFPSLAVLFSIHSRSHVYRWTRVKLNSLMYSVPFMSSDLMKQKMTISYSSQVKRRLDKVDRMEEIVCFVLWLSLPWHHHRRHHHSFVIQHVFPVYHWERLCAFGDDAHTLTHHISKSFVSLWRCVIAHEPWTNSIMSSIIYGNLFFFFRFFSLFRLRLRTTEIHPLSFASTFDRLLAVGRELSWIV